MACVEGPGDNVQGSESNYAQTVPEQGLTDRLDVSGQVRVDSTTRRADLRRQVEEIEMDRDEARGLLEELRLTRQRRESQLREAETTLQHLRGNVAELEVRRERLAEENELQRIVLREMMDHSGGVSAFVSKHVLPLYTIMHDVLLLDDEQIQTAISLFGMVAGYFLYEPAIEALLGQPLRSPSQLKARRRHVVALAERLTAGE